MVCFALVGTVFGLRESVGSLMEIYEDKREWVKSYVKKYKRLRKIKKNFNELIQNFGNDITKEDGNNENILTKILPINHGDVEDYTTSQYN